MNCTEKKAMKNEGSTNNQRGGVVIGPLLLLILGVLLMATNPDEAKTQDKLNAELSIAEGMISCRHAPAGGVCWEKGKLQDIDRGLEWYKKAAEQGNVDAMSRLARIYRFGLKGAPKSLLKSLYWAARCKISQL